MPESSMSWTSGAPLMDPAGVARAAASMRPRLAAGGFGVLSPAGLDGAVQAFCTAVTDLLRVDLVEVLVGGWRTHAQLRAAGHRTAVPPGGEEIVEIGRHRITSEHRPYVDLLLNGRTVGTVHFVLTLVLDLTAVAVTVRRGALVDVRPSRSGLTVTLASEGVRLASHTTQVALPGLLSFGAGYPVVNVQRSAGTPTP